MIMTERSEILARLRALEQACKAKETSYEESREETKRRKQEFDDAVQDLRHAADESTEELPLFDGNGRLAKPDRSLAEIFEAAGLSEALTATCRAQDLLTAGDLERWLGTARAEGDVARLNDLTDLPGVTKTKAERIRKALREGGGQ